MSASMRRLMLGGAAFMLGVSGLYLRWAWRIASLQAISFAVFADIAIITALSAALFVYLATEDYQ